jgi:hypothetical protein
VLATLKENGSVSKRNMQTSKLTVTRASEKKNKLKKQSVKKSKEKLG